MLHQHLAGQLVFPTLRDVEVDLEKGVGVPVKHRRDALLLEQVDVLQPVEVPAGRQLHQVEVLDERDVLLVLEPTTGEGLGIDCNSVLWCHGPQPPLPAICFASISFISASARSSLTPGM